MRLLLLLALALSARASCIPPPNTYDWEAQRWAVTDIPANSGTISGASYRSGTIFMQQSKVWGLRPSLKRVMLYLGDNTNALCVPIIYDWNSGSATNARLRNFVAADYSESTGLTGDGSSKYVEVESGNTFAYNGSGMSKTNSHQACYVRTGSNEGSDCSGVTDGVNGTWAVAVANGGNTYTFVGLTFNNTADSNGKGFYNLVRLSSTFAAMYKNGIGLITNTTSDTANVTGGGVVLHAFNSAGTIGSFSSRALSYYSAGNAIQIADQPTFNILVQGVQKRAGRDVQ